MPLAVHLLNRAQTRIGATDMKKMMLVVTVALSSLLTACGPGAKIDSKEAAAEAVHALTGASKSGAERSLGGLNTASATVSCPKGGSVELSAFEAKVGTSMSLEYTMTLKACGLASSSQGNAVYDGSVVVSQKVDTSLSSVKVEQHFKGSLRISGAFNDSLDVDISELVAVDSMGTSAGSVNVELHGSVKTSSDTYTYDGQVTVQGGTITISGKGQI